MVDFLRPRNMNPMKLLGVVGSGSVVVLSSLGCLLRRKLFFRRAVLATSGSVVSRGSRLCTLSTSDRRLLAEYTLDAVELFMIELRNGGRCEMLPGTLDTLYDEPERCRLNVGEE